MYTLLYTYAIPAHSLVLTGSQALVPAGPEKTLLSKMLTAIGTHTGSLVFSFGIVVIFYIPSGCVIYFMHTCAMCGYYNYNNITV